MMHRNTIFALLLVVTAGMMISLSSCNSGSSEKDLRGLQGVWDYQASGTADFVGYYSVGPRRVQWGGVYSISPIKVTDRLGYDWEWTYDGNTLKYQMMKGIPIIEDSGNELLIEGLARFELPIEWGDKEAHGVMLLNNADVTCTTTSETGYVSGAFSVHMIKR